MYSQSLSAAMWLGGISLCGACKEAGLGMQCDLRAGKARRVVCKGLATVPPTDRPESGTSVLLCHLELRATPVLGSRIQSKGEEQEPYECSLTLWQAQEIQM